MQEQIRIIKEDITRMHVDAIVNAANEQLAQGGGVCGAIFHAAGSKELTAACTSIGYCHTGDAVITPGFNLHAQWIIHTVGPVWKDGSHNEREALVSCYEKSLDLAERYHCSSIAFPLISSGIFGYPKKEAWQTAVRTCLDYFNRTLNYRLTVYFCVLDDDAEDLGEKTLQQYEYKRNPVLFHDPQKEYGCFSNWYPCTFEIEGIRYSCSEQYMMAKKALLFNDLYHYALIMNTDSPEQCQSYGRDVEGYKQSDWDQVKYAIVFHAVKEKFKQNRDLLLILFSTENALIAEASKSDKVWGIGLGASDPKATDPDQWKGENLLGKVLMQARDELLNELCLQKNKTLTDLKCQMLPVVQKQEIKKEKSKTQGYPWSYPIYPEVLKDWMKKMYDMDLIDQNYLFNISLIDRKKPVSDLTRNEILTILTHFLREDHFNPGTIAGYVENGRIEELGARLKEITA